MIQGQRTGLQAGPSRAARVLLFLGVLAWGWGGGGRAWGGQGATSAAVMVTARGDSTVQSGDVIQLVISGLRRSVAAKDITVAFAPAGGSTAVASAKSGSTEDQGNGTYLITVTVPSSLRPAAPAGYNVSLSGLDSSGAKFSSSNAASITIDPPASIASIAVASAHAGQTLTVTIAGHFTKFKEGATLASFGAGVSVGGAAAGAPGPVTVKGATLAIARLSINSTAAIGPRDVTLSTDGRTIAARGAFGVEAPLHVPTIVPGGPYTGTAGAPVIFDGSGSTDPNGSRLTLTWETGDHGLIAGAKVQHTYASAGLYAVTVTGTDALGATASAHTTVTISAPEQPLTVLHGGPYAGTVGQSISFNGSGSRDSSGFGLTYTWSFGDGAEGSGASATHAYAAAGRYTVILTIDNGHGKSSSATTQATIKEAATAVVADAGGPYSGVAGQAIQFDGSRSSGGYGNPLTYAWSFGDGESAAGATPVHTYASSGTYNVTLTVDNGHGGTNLTTTSLTILMTAGVTANAGGPYTGVAGEVVAFNGGKSTGPSGDTLTYKWTFGDKTTGTGETPTHTYSAAGTYEVGLTVEDGHGGSGSASTTAVISAAAAAPVADPGGPYSGIPGQTIQFDGTQSFDPSDTTLTYAWNFGDKTTATGAQPTHKYAAAGVYTVTLTVNDGTVSASATTTATVTAVVGVTISSPMPGTLTNIPSIAVSGTVAASGAKVSVNGTEALVSGEKWTAKSVALREGVNLITATATVKNGSTGTASVSVTLDTTPPSVSIVSPAAGAKVFSPQITVSGLVSDLVAGTVNAQNVSVAVNGVAASVVNRSFSAPNILLSPGLNTIAVVATDKAGNTGQASVQVRYQAQITQQSILAVSGNGQTGVINSVLPEPLVAQLVAANGQPMAGRPVTFTVTRSDGQVEVLPSQGRALSVLTDAKGHASVLFQIGSRAGVGINQVTATSPGFTGQAVFTATSTSAQPAFIHPVIGEHQRGIIGQRAPQPFQVIVTDRMGNPLEGVSVTFTVTAGGGNIGGETTVTQETNSDGKATVSVTLGMQEGIGNNLVSADFKGDMGSPVIFQASGLVPGPPSQTSVTGVVLDNTNTPVKGATASLEGTNLRTTTNAQGQFTLSGAPVGTVTLLIDGSTSSSTITYPSLSFVLQALPGVANSLDKPIYLPAVDTENAQTVGGDQPVTLTMTGVPGVAFTVQPNSVTFPDGSHVGKLSVSQVKVDMVPMEPVNGVSAPLVWTIQPAGAKFNPPIQVQLPNVSGMAPGTVTEIYQYDHDLEQFVSGGTARVSPDGSVIVSDPGFGIVKAGWGHQLPPPPPINCTVSCDDDNDCTQDSFNAPCGCSHTPLTGNSCGKPNPSQGKNTCYLKQGICKNGVCKAKKKPAGSSCNDGVFCTNPDKCNANGACIGTPVPDTNPVTGTSFSFDFTSAFKKVQDYVNMLTGKDDAGSLSVSYSSSTKYSCCEMKKIMKAEDDQQTAKLSLSTTISKVYVPQYTITIPGTKYAVGPYASFGISEDLSATYHKSQCNGNCISGGLGGGGTISAGYGGSLPGELANVDLSASTGITMNSNFGCHQVSWDVSVNDLTGQVSFKFLDGKIGWAGNVVLFRGGPIATGSQSIP